MDSTAIAQIQNEIECIMQLNSKNTQQIEKKKEMIQILKKDINELYLVQEKYNEELKSLYETLNKAKAKIKSRTDKT
ncbi:unnamed protein product [Rotaria sp. Silwood2]|nr:unnamed protein product [Rotaria sp. Silwood2]CAF4525833.1 unnamed protein product [Rotaria sp. Silwood2]